MLSILFVFLPHTDSQTHNRYAIVVRTFRYACHLFSFIFIMATLTLRTLRTLGNFRCDVFQPFCPIQLTPHEAANMPQLPKGFALGCCNKQATKGKIIRIFFSLTLTLSLRLR